VFRLLVGHFCWSTSPCAPRKRAGPDPSSRHDRDCIPPHPPAAQHLIPSQLRRIAEDHGHVRSPAATPSVAGIMITGPVDPNRLRGFAAASRPAVRRRS
jgi:hypothetical protein